MHGLILNLEKDQNTHKLFRKAENRLKNSMTRNFYFLTLN